MWKMISCPAWNQWMGIWHISYFVVFYTCVSKCVCICIYIYIHFIEKTKSINGTTDTKFPVMATGKCDHPYL